MSVNTGRNAMRKILSLYNLVHKHGAALLIPFYCVVGIVAVPRTTLTPEIGSVQNVTFSECHIGQNGKRVCSGNSSVVVAMERSGQGHGHGSTGPTNPPPPEHRMH